MKKLIATLLIATTLTQTIPVFAQTVPSTTNKTSVSANSNLSDEEIIVDGLSYKIVYVNDLNQMIQNNSNRQKRSITGIAVFVSGILVGWVVDGVILAETGKSAAEWTAVAIKKYKAGQIKNNKINISKSELGTCNHYAPGQPC